jgi:hypothetical protein
MIMRRALALFELVTSIQVISVPALAGRTRPKPLNVTPAGNPAPAASAVLKKVAGIGTAKAVVPIPARAAVPPSLPLRLWTTAGQLVVTVMQPTVQVTAPVGAVRLKRTSALLVTAVLRAN